MNSSKNIDHGNYIPSPILPGMKVADGEHIRKVFVLSADDVAAGAEVAERVEATVGSTGSPTTKVTEIPSNIEVGADAALDLTVIVLPGVSARIPLTIDLTGAHSEVRLSGIYLCSGHDEVTFDITMHHRTGDCRSRPVSYTHLRAHETERTEAFQENHNILLSDSARINTKPRLEIYADDVKCSHGATVGKLNEDEQFYMRSRGIPEEEAKVLQMISFVAPVLENIPEDSTDGTPARTAVAELVENAIRGL